MGSSQSSEVKQTIEVLNQSMTNLVTKNQNSASARNINANNLSIDFDTKARYAPGVDPNKCGLNISQKINASQTVKLMAKFASSADLKSQMKTALQNSIDQASTSKQAALATTLNTQKSKQSISQKVSNIVETNITNEVLNEVNGFLDNVNNGTIYIKGIMPCSINIDQKIISDQVVTMLSDAMIGTSVSNSTDTAASAVSKQKTASEQTGVIGELAGLLGTMGMIWVAVIGIIVLGVVFFLPTILKAVGGGGTTKMGNGSFAQMLFGRRKVRFGRRFR
jgi:hypothetical protein